MKVFYLKRTEDESGVSGTGRVAQGFIFDNGKVAVTWLSEHPSVTIYDNIGEVHAIHSHGGKTEVIMEPDYKRAFGELKSFIDDFSLSEACLSIKHVRIPGSIFDARETNLILLKHI